MNYQQQEIDLSNLFDIIQCMKESLITLDEDQYPIILNNAIYGLDSKTNGNLYKIASVLDENLLEYTLSDSTTENILEYTISDSTTENNSFIDTVKILNFIPGDRFQKFPQTIENINNLFNYIINRIKYVYLYHQIDETKILRNNSPLSKKALAILKQGIREIIEHLSNFMISEVSSTTE